jgi:hypothetical protein
MSRLAALAAAAILLAVPGATALEPRGGVTLRALDKVTGNAVDLDARTGDTISFGRLTLTVRACYQAPETDTPESAAYVEIRSKAAKSGAEADESLFAGWMFASSPGLNALEHPTYDVWVISCSASAPR